MRFSRSCAASAVAVVALAAGCGGGDEEHDAFVEQLNAICRRHLEALEALPPPRSSQQLLTYVEGLTEIAQTQLDELDALTPPEDDREGFERMVGQMRTTFALYPQLRQAVFTSPRAVDAVLEQAEASNAAAGRAAAELGADDCTARDDED
jgi:hypothetical protein